MNTVYAREHAKSSARFSWTDIRRAREYWNDLTDDDLVYYWGHYTTGAGSGMYPAVKSDTSFNDYLVLSAAQTCYERQHDL